MIDLRKFFGKFVALDMDEDLNLTLKEDRGGSENKDFHIHLQQQSDSKLWFNTDRVDSNVKWRLFLHKPSNPVALVPPEGTPEEVAALYKNYSENQDRMERYQMLLEQNRNLREALEESLAKTRLFLIFVLILAAFNLISFIGKSV